MVVRDNGRIEMSEGGVGENDRLLNEGEGDVVGDDEIQRIQNDESERSIQEIVTNVMLE